MLLATYELRIKKRLFISASLLKSARFLFWFFWPFKLSRSTEWTSIFFSLNIELNKRIVVLFKKTGLLG